MISVTQVIAGTADNVVPSSAVCRGTIRAFSPERRQAAWEAVQRIAHGVAAARGLTCAVERNRDGCVALLFAV